MPGEGDQTKWVGIRPTDPAEAIPVTESAPLTNILTQKKAPAIADLQAIKDVLRLQISTVPADVRVSLTVSFAAVPAGELWVITNITGRNATSLCDMYFQYQFPGTVYYLSSVLSVAPMSASQYAGFIVMEETGYIQVTYALGGWPDVLQTDLHGYKVGLY